MNTPESHHRVNTYYASIDKVLFELELRFRGNDQEILCALGDICHSETPSEESFYRVAKFYEIDYWIVLLIFSAVALAEKVISFNLCYTCNVIYNDLYDRFIYVRIVSLWIQM